VEDRTGALPSSRVRDWLETQEPDPQLPLLAYAAGLDVDLGADGDGAKRRAVLLLAAGGDPHRDLDLDGRAVTALAADLDDPARRAELLAGLDALAMFAVGLPKVSAAISFLLDDPDLAWRAYAAAVLADALGEDG
jgi:hypothetical protein